MKQVEFCPFCGEKYVMPNNDGSYECYKCQSVFSVCEGVWKDERSLEQRIMDNDVFDL